MHNSTKASEKANLTKHVKILQIISTGSTLKRDPMEENLDDFDVSSGSGGNRPATKEHFDAVKRS